MSDNGDAVDFRRWLHQHAVWTPDVIQDIQLKAELGRYRYRGMSTTRPVPNMDDLTFLTCTLSRVPLEGYRERCVTETVLGTRFAERPVRLKIPITVVGMSFGALSRNAKAGIGLGATRAGTSTTTGDGGMHPMERENSEHRAEIMEVGTAHRRHTGSRLNERRLLFSCGRAAPARLDARADGRFPRGTPTWPPFGSKCRPRRLRLLQRAPGAG